MQNLYEAVRSDRNLYSKNLIESQDEITEMKRKLKIMNHQIDQLKEEIMAKEAALVKEHLEHQRVEKEKDALKAELQRMKQQAAESKAYIEQQEVEERKLLKIISEADAERLRQKKELDQVGLLQREHCSGSLLSSVVTVTLHMYHKPKPKSLHLANHSKRRSSIRILGINLPLGANAGKRVQAKSFVFGFNLHSKGRLKLNSQ